jgi:hypothetical protein
MSVSVMSVSVMSVSVMFAGVMSVIVMSASVRPSTSDRIELIIKDTSNLQTCI